MYMIPQEGQMDRIFSVLQDVDNGLQTGIPVGKGSDELASVICSAVCEHKSENSWGCSNAKSSRPQTMPSLSRPLMLMDENKQDAQQKEIMCFALSMLERMSFKLLSQNHPMDGSLYYKEVLRTSLEDMDLMSKLVSLFSVQDNILSHLAVKCASSVVLFQLLQSNSIDRVWQQTCFQTFERGFPSNDMVSCLWSLTAVVKGLLKGTHERKRETLEDLLVSFDPVFPDLCTGLLSCRAAGSDIAARQGHSCRLETVLVTFIDLLEALAAARVKLRVCSLSQRALHLQAPVFLQLVNSPAHYTVKKKALLLLKRVVLQKAGEDVCTGEAQPTARADGHMTADTRALVDAVLQAARSGWVQRLSVSAEASLFGGTSALGPAGRQGPDFVMLRAVSLVVLKSLEYKVRHVGKEGSQCAVDTESYLSPLMVFLSQHLTRNHHLGHACAWVSLVFGEQDDDMIEAAKTLMLLFLYQKRMKATSDEDACSTGYNPHCHFIFLLKSVAFDHSVLLDFLISAETCFLEYFVGYLKFLRGDWEGFRRVCLRTQGLDLVEPGRAGFPFGQGSATRSEPPVNQTDPWSTASGVARSSFGPLVDYGSSGDSEPEEPSSSDRPSDETQDRGPVLKGATAGEPSPCLPDHAAEEAKDDHPTPDSMCTKAVMCLTELRKVVAKLQKRNLFPYNPASLLRLLRQMEPNGGFGDGSRC